MSAFVAMNIALPCFAVVEEPENPGSGYAKIAATISEREIEEGVFEVFQGDKMHEEFSKENIELDVSVPFNVKVRYFFGKRADMNAIKDEVVGYNKTYLSCVFSGLFQLYPRDHFASEGIYQEANARDLYAMFAHPNAGMHVDETDFSLDIEQLVINGDQAKVIAERNYDVVHGDSKGQVQCGGPEAYLLKKVDGDWKIENIIFESFMQTPTSTPNKVFTQFEQAGKNENWLETYSFEKCPRSTYESDENFSDYIEGSIDSPVFLIEKGHFGYMQ